MQTSQLKVIKNNWSLLTEVEAAGIVDVLLNSSQQPKVKELLMIINWFLNYINFHT